jgi:hypothetical protein
MLDDLKPLPEDPAELRQVTELLMQEVKAQALMIEKLQHQLHGANRNRFGSKSESLDQLQLFTENAEIAAAEKPDPTKPAEAAATKDKPKRKPLPNQNTRYKKGRTVLQPSAPGPTRKSWGCPRRRLDCV